MGSEVAINGSAIAMTATLPGNGHRWITTF